MLQPATIDRVWKRWEAALALAQRDEIPAWRVMERMSTEDPELFRRLMGFEMRAIEIDRTGRASMLVTRVAALMYEVMEETCKTDCCPCSRWVC